MRFFLTKEHTLEKLKNLFKEKGIPYTKLEVFGKELNIDGYFSIEDLEKLGIIINELNNKSF